MKIYVFVIIALLGLILPSYGKIFTRCKLAVELVNTNMIQKTFLGSWVCLIEKVSKRDTRALVTTPSGKKYFGLYQIPSPKWCKEGKKGGECNIACEMFLDDDIRDDTACAATIFHREGFKFWPQYIKNCKKDTIQFITNEIYKCPGFPPRSSPDTMTYSEILGHKKMVAAMPRSKMATYRAKGN